MSDDSMKWDYRMMINGRAPDEYRQHALIRARREAGLKLFDILMQSRLPAVVDIEEDIIINGSGMTGYYLDDAQDEIRIRYTITPVQRQQWVMPRYVDDYQWQRREEPEKVSFWQRLKGLVFRNAK